MLCYVSIYPRILVCTVLFAGRVFYYLKSLIESIKQQFDSILSQVKDEVMAKRWLWNKKKLLGF